MLVRGGNVVVALGCFIYIDGFSFATLNAYLFWSNRCNWRVFVKKVLQHPSHLLLIFIILRAKCISLSLQANVPFPKVILNFILVWKKNTLEWHNLTPTKDEDGKVSIVSFSAPWNQSFFQKLSWNCQLPISGSSNQKLRKSKRLGNKQARTLYRNTFVVCNSDWFNHQVIWLKKIFEEIHFFMP